jgi:replicative DNA helicase
MKTKSQDASHVVLTGLARSRVMRERYLHSVAPDDFNSKSSRRVLEAIKNLHLAGHDVTIDTLKSCLKNAADQMFALMLFDMQYDGDITPEIFQDFKSSGQQNRLVNVATLITSELNKGTDTELILEKVRQGMQTLDEGDNIVEVSTPDMTVDSAQFVIDQWAAGDRPIISGLPELDEKLFLSQFIGYWVMAGNSGVGKSAMMTHIAKANARRGIGVTICSLEMSKELLLIRMAMEDPSVKGLELTEKTIKNKVKMDALRRAMDDLRKLPIYIVEGVYDVFRLDRIARRNAIDRDCRLTLFDYLQLGQTKPTDNDVVRVYTTSRMLQGLTRRDIPNGYQGQTVIALSQYSNEATKGSSLGADESEKGPGQRPSAPPRRPNNSDLAWSGQIKQDADGILHIYPTSAAHNDRAGVEIFCGKQRMYRMGWGVAATFLQDEQRFVTPLSMRQAQAPGPRNVPKERKVNFSE